MLFCLIPALKNATKLFIQASGSKVMSFSIPTLPLLLVHVAASSAMAAVTDVVKEQREGLKYIENIHNFGTSGLSEDFRSALDS